MTQRFTPSQDFSEATASRNWEILRLALARMIFPTQDCTATQYFMQAEPVSIMYRNQKGKLLELGSIQAGGSGDYFPTQGNKCSIPKHHTKAEEKIFLGQNVSHTANCATEKTPRRRFFCRRADPGVTCEEISDCSRGAGVEEEFVILSKPKEVKGHTTTLMPLIV